MNRCKWACLPAGLALTVFALTAGRAEEVAKKPAKAAESEARLKKDITFLASPECEGRGPTTEGSKKAAAYIADQFKAAGLKPANPDGSYFQDFTLNAFLLEEPSKLKITGPRGEQLLLQQGKDYWPLPLGASGGAKAAGVVFAGHGVTIKNKEKGKEDAEPLYDDYAGLDAAGKVVVVVRGLPKSVLDAVKVPPADRQRYPSWTEKVLNAERHKAAALLVVHDADTAATGDDLLDFNFFAMSRPHEGKLPVFHAHRSLAESMLRSAGVVASLKDIEGEIARDAKPQSRELPGWTVDASLKMTRGKLPVKNVVGILDGKGPLANETVVVGAHYDHLGYGGFSSLGGGRKMAIHHGADDNGSGTTAMMELARRFAALPDRQGRRIVFAAFAGEELGLFGSKHYADKPVIPLEQTVAMLNLDMVGRLKADKDGKEKLLVEGLGTGKHFKDLVDGLNQKYGFSLAKMEGVSPNSDHASFEPKKIPVLFFWTGVHPDYHAPTDTADKINIDGMRRITDLSEDVLANFTTGPVPEFQKVKAPPRPAPSSGPRLGIVPEYADEGEGVLLSGVRDDSLAEKAGLKAGDRIVKLMGKDVKNLEAYMQVMSTVKPGDDLEIGVLRAGKPMTLKVKVE